MSSSGARPQLASLDADALASVLRFLDCVSLAAVGAACRYLRKAASCEELWARLLEASFFDACRNPLLPPAIRWTDDERDDPMRSMREARAMSARQLFWRLCARTGEALASLPHQTTTPRAIGSDTRCRGCGDSLYDAFGRCPCVAARGAQLPLQMFSLSARRSGATSLESGTFSEMLETLGKLFELSIRTADTLEPHSLDGTDVVLLCTTEGQGLSEGELHELKRYVRSGGTAIVSAFANWSRHNHFNAALSGWLGVDTLPREQVSAQPRPSRLRASASVCD